MIPVETGPGSEIVNGDRKSRELDSEAVIEKNT
jgi:hypothetical protein